MTESPGQNLVFPLMVMVAVGKAFTVIFTVAGNDFPFELVVIRVIVLLPAEEYTTNGFWLVEEEGFPPGIDHSKPLGLLLPPPVRNSVSPSH